MQSLMTDFTHLSSAIANFLFLEGRLSSRLRLGLALNIKVSFKYPYFLVSLVFSCLVTHEATQLFWLWLPGKFASAYCVFGNL